MISENIQYGISQSLTSQFHKQVRIEKIQAVGGGDINQAFVLQTNHGKYFIKMNTASRYPFMFEKEAKGLSILKNSGEVVVPGVITPGEYDDHAYLIMEYVETKEGIENFWEDFGRSLARLHQHQAEKFGLDHDNYIGSLHQSNTNHNTWPGFFIEERLEKQVKMARDRREISPGTVHAFERLYKRLDEIFPEEAPALLHGDLWSGNFMTGNQGKACLIDPAVYYGHREMDLGMSKLFGGFDPEFYRYYHQEYPLEKDWEKRTDICNLYPLMVHVNLFGGSYVYSVEKILKRF